MTVRYDAQPPECERPFPTRNGPGILPNVIGVGFGKAGTSYIANVLRRHPQVCFSTLKETHYFTERKNRKQYRSDLSGYCKYYSGYDNRRHKVVAEWSNTYIYDPLALDRILKHLPHETKILICYRDPVDAIISTINYRLMNGAGPRDLTPRQTIDCDRERYFERFCYDDHIGNVLSRFPRDNIYIMRFEDMVSRTEEFFHDLFEFLEISKSSVFERVPIANYSQIARSPRIHHYVRRIAILLHGARSGKEMMRWDPPSKPAWLRVVQGLNTKELVTVDQELEDELQLLFEPHMTNFKRLISA